VVELFLNKPKEALHFQFLITLISESFWRSKHMGSYICSSNIQGFISGQQSFNKQHKSKHWRSERNWTVWPLYLALFFIHRKKHRNF